jgi:hypothetical protein
MPTTLNWTVRDLKLREGIWVGRCSATDGTLSLTSPIVLSFIGGMTVAMDLTLLKTLCDWCIAREVLEELRALHGAVFTAFYGTTANGVRANRSGV